MSVAGGPDHISPIDLAAHRLKFSVRFDSVMVSFQKAEAGVKQGKKFILTDQNRGDIHVDIINSVVASITHCANVDQHRDDRASDIP